jgi:hypothetical protein
MLEVQTAFQVSHKTILRAGSAPRRFLLAVQHDSVLPLQGQTLVALIIT